MLAGQEDVMTTGEAATPSIGKPEDFDRDPVLLRDRIAEAQRNRDFFRAHSEELLERYPDHWLLIHSGGEVAPFDDLVELMTLRDTFDEVTRRGSIIERRRTGVWVL